MPVGACQPGCSAAIVPDCDAVAGDWTIRRLVLILAAMALGLPVSANGVDSHAYNCAGLQALIAQSRWIFINNPDFEDTVVADARECSYGGYLEWRSVPTTDNPECIVFRCGKARGSGVN